MPPNKMKFVKGLGLAILSLLLFLSLSVFGLVLTLNQTILNPNFTISQIDRLDIASLTGDMLGGQIPQEVVNDTIADLKPWMREQVRDGIYSMYDYLEGRSQSLSLVVSLQPLKERLRENLKEAVLRSPPPELAGLPPDVIERYFDEFYPQISQEIPSTFELNETSIPPEVMTQLEQARQIIGYIHLSYNALIGFILLLIVLIIVINREVKGSTRGLGMTFLSCGLLSLVDVFIVKDTVAIYLNQLGMPAYLQAWLSQFLADTLAPLEIYGIGLLAVGVVLLIVSLVYKPRQPSF